MVFNKIPVKYRRYLPLPVVLLLIAAFTVAVWASAEAEEITKEQQIMCYEQGLMAQGIQMFRITSHDDLDTMIEVINSRTNARSQREIKFWLETIRMARKVYEFDIGIAPDKVGAVFEQACYVELKKEGVEV
jgi:hypothetical protein